MFYPQKRQQQHSRTLINCIIVGATAGALKAKNLSNGSLSDTVTQMAAGACIGALMGTVIGSFQYLTDILDDDTIIASHDERAIMLEQEDYSHPFE